MLIAAVVVLLLLKQTLGASTIPLPKNLQCHSSLECFDSTSLVCSEDCHDCPSSHLQINVECSIDQLRQGNCDEFSCSSECYENNQAVSSDQRTCTRCSTSGGAANLYDSSTFDNISSECTCNNPGKGSPTGSAVRAKKLVEIYDDTSGLPIRKDCLTCPKGMAIITEDLYEEGHNFYITAGRKYTANPYQCVSCPDQNMIFDTSYSCVCSDGYLLTGEASIGEQSCISTSHSPSISNPGYAKVRFQDPTILGRYDFTLESITMSHLYIKASSECEFYKASTGKSSCQALGNLCVLNMYDEDSPACMQFEIISQKRLETYHGIKEWKYTMPWLYYSDESEYITNDKSLNMKISFQPQSNYVHELTFKLAKYTVNGTFVGIEDLTNQFEYCRNSLSQDRKPHWLSFGMTHRHEYSCSIEETLLGKEMYLYDMYIVDNSCGGDLESTDSFDCLYPVPVLNRNLVRDNQFPNINQKFGDDIDDQYTRRFFLFDN